MRDWINRFFEIRFNHCGNMLSLAFKPQSILRLRYGLLYTLDFFRKKGCLVKCKFSRGYNAKEGWVYFPNYIPPKYRLRSFLRW